MDKRQEAKPDPSATPSAESSASSDPTPQTKSIEGPPATTGKTTDPDLPVVESPTLHTGPELEPNSVAPADSPKPEIDLGAAHGRASRLAPLAAAVAIAAALGSLAGALSASVVAALSPTATPGSTGEEMTAALRALKVQSAELTMIRANLDGTSRSAGAQFAKISERLDRVERAALDPAKIAHITETVDRLDKRAGIPSEITGSVGSSQSPAAATEPRLSERVLPDWVVQGVQRGRALIENRYCGMFDVSAGSVLPGLGRVQAIKREDGRWIVITARGLITSTGR